jgi:hypothetical protein
VAEVATSDGQFGDVQRQGYVQSKVQCDLGWLAPRVEIGATIELRTIGAVDDKIVGGEKSLVPAKRRRGQP